MSSVWPQDTALEVNSSLHQQHACSTTEGLCFALTRVELKKPRFSLLPRLHSECPFFFGKSFMLHKHMLFWSPQVMKGGDSTLVKKMCKCKYQAQLVPTFSQSELKVSPWFSLGLLQSLWCPLRGKAQTETEPFVSLLASVLTDTEHSQPFLKPRELSAGFQWQLEVHWPSSRVTNSTLNYSPLSVCENVFM